MPWNTDAQRQSAGDGRAADIPCLNLLDVKSETQNMNMTKANRWRFPRVSYTNYRKAFPNSGSWNDWFRFRRYWGGRIWNISVKHHQISLDFRMCFMSDMMFPEADEKSRKAVKDAEKCI